MFGREFEQPQFSLRVRWSMVGEDTNCPFQLVQAMRVEMNRIPDFQFDMVEAFVVGVKVVHNDYVRWCLGQINDLLFGGNQSKMDDLSALAR